MSEKAQSFWLMGGGLIIVWEDGVLAFINPDSKENPMTIIHMARVELENLAEMIIEVLVDDETD